MQFPDIENGRETDGPTERASSVLISLLWGGKSEINQRDHLMANNIDDHVEVIIFLFLWFTYNGQVFHFVAGSMQLIWPNTREFQSPTDTIFLQD